MRLQRTREAASVAVAKVDNVPVVELSVYRLIVGEDAPKMESLGPQTRRPKQRLGSQQALLYGGAPTAASLVDDPFVRAAPAPLPDHIAGWRAVQAHSTLRQ